ncbi:Protein of unknown function DUF761 [Theobroma cacao]|nr:Protein of unknown function DUF761 [Theobroma cacao]
MPNKKTSVVAEKAWNLLRLALLWARKAAVFKVKGHGSKALTDQIPYWERQLSFDKTPDFHVKKGRLAGSMRFLFPCTGAKAVEFDYDVGADEAGGIYSNDSGRETYSREEEEEEEEEEAYEYKNCEKKSQLEEEGIDSRAEKFIAEFYDQIKFQN